MEVLLLAHVGNVDAPVCFQIKQSVPNGSQISRIIIKTTILLDNDQWQGKLFDSNNLGPF